LRRFRNISKDTVRCTSVEFEYAQNEKSLSNQSYRAHQQIIFLDKPIRSAALSLDSWFMDYAGYDLDWWRIANTICPTTKELLNTTNFQYNIDSTAPLNV
jgi:hypothetical protein